jgi:hypothetical protein
LLMQMTYFSYALIASAISCLNISVVTHTSLQEAPAEGKQKRFGRAQRGAYQNLRG